MASEFSNYDLSAVMLSFAGIPITGGLGEGAITISRPGKLWEEKVGDDGSVTRYRLGDRRHTVSLKLQHGAVANGILSTLLKVDDGASNGLGIAPFALIDPSSSFTLITDKAYISGPPPEVALGAEPGDREWVFTLPDAERTD